jgi:mxaA protein
MRASALAALLLAAAPLCAAGASEATVVVEPLRRYGYVIGDEVELRAVVEVPPGYALEAASLPRPGRANAFLELRSVGRENGLLGQLRSGPAQRFSLRYVVVNSGTEVVVGQTPTVTLQFRRGGAPDVPAVIPQLDFTVSPLTPAHVAGIMGLEEMQPDAPAPPLSARMAHVRLLLYALVALLLAGYLAWRQGWLPRRMLAHRSFARAVAEIRRLDAAALAGAQAARAWRLHRAFDEAAGFAVADHNLERFFAAQPWSAALAAEVREFFTGSTRFFYADDAAAMMAPDRMLALARALADGEPRRVALA